MGTPRRVTGAVALLPLCLVVSACGTQGPGAESASVGDVRGVEVPTEALAPAMPEPVVAQALVAAPERAVPVRAAVAVPAPTRTELDDVPVAALSAYHRAAMVMGEAAPECRLQWHLIAAIGRVETKHGHGRLDEDGLASPALVGAPLDGRHRRPVVRDTDAGQLDRDSRWDRPVGPFRMLPATWSVVGVDADTDGQRNPQDIDDAALGTAVQLCGRGHDLSTREEMRRALRRLRSEPGYPATVLSWYDAYVEAEAAMAVASTTVVTYGDWSGAVDQVTRLARPATATEPRRKPKRPAKPTKQPETSPEPGVTKPKPPAEPVAEAPDPEPTEAPAAEDPVAKAPVTEAPVTEDPVTEAPDPGPTEAEPTAEPSSGDPDGDPACEPEDPVEPEPTVTPTDGATEPEECVGG